MPLYPTVRTSVTAQIFAWLTAAFDGTQATALTRGFGALENSFKTVRAQFALTPSSADIRAVAGLARGSLRVGYGISGDTAGAGTVIMALTATRYRRGVIPAQVDSRTDTFTLTAADALSCKDADVWVPKADLRAGDVLRILRVQTGGTYGGAVTVHGWGAYLEHGQDPYSLGVTPNGV